MPAGLILESLVAVLLIVTIGYCFILNRRLGLLRGDQTELNEVVRVLNEAADRARNSVEHLRRSSVSIAEELSDKITAGRALSDELGVIVESGNSLADRLADASSASRSAARKPGPLEALTRLDQGIRRQPLRENPPRREAALAKAEHIHKDSPPDSDLRQVLKAMR